MNDMGSGNFRTFDPAKEDGAEPPQPRGNSLRDRIKRSELAQQPASGASRSGYVHEPQPAPEAQAEAQPQAQPNYAPQPPAEPQQSAPEPQYTAPAQPQAEIQPSPAPAPATVRTESPAPAPKVEAKPVPQEQPQQPQAAPSENGAQPIGVVLEISGAGSQVAIDLQRLGECSEDDDPSVAMAGQVGSQIKIRVGNNWLLASVRNQKQDRKAGSILANIDFLGEGVEEKLTGRLHGFRRGVTRYPVPGAMVYPASTADLKQVMPAMAAARSRSARFIRPRTFAQAFMSTPCSASISRCSARPVLVNRRAPP